MHSDSQTTRHQKEFLVKKIKEVHGIELPDWLAEGITVADFKALRRIIDGARNRYLTDDNGTGCSGITASAEDSPHGYWEAGDIS